MTRSHRPGVLLALLVASVAGAHWETPEAIVADLNGRTGREAGIERALRDEKTPRLLVIRVGEGWYRLPVERRRSEAEGWLVRWRRSVGQGVVAVLDARTDRPVVHFAPGGRVGTVAAPPRSHGCGIFP